MQPRGDDAAAVLPTREIFLFEDFRLDRHGGGLFRRDDGGAFAPVAIGLRCLDILGVLIARAREAVSKDEIIAAVWPARVIEDSNLTVQIASLRRVLDRERPKGAASVVSPAGGYRFVTPVTWVTPNAATAGPHTSEVPSAPRSPSWCCPLPISAMI